MMTFAENEDLVSQCVWALSNIAADNTRFRDYITYLKVVPYISQLIMNSKSSIKLKKECVFLLTNLMVGKPSPYVEDVKGGILTFGFILNKTSIEQILSNDQTQIKEMIQAILIGLLSLTKQYHTVITDLFHQFTLHGKFVHFLTCQDPTILNIASQLIGEICCHYDTEPEIFIKNGLIDVILQKL